MRDTGHKRAWREAVACVWRLDVRWVVLPAVGAESAAKKLCKPTYGK